MKNIIFLMIVTSSFLLFSQEECKMINQVSFDECYNLFVKETKKETINKIKKADFNTVTIQDFNINKIKRVLNSKCGFNQPTSYLSTKFEDYGIHVESQLLFMLKLFHKKLNKKIVLFESELKKIRKSKYKKNLPSALRFEVAGKNKEFFQDYLNRISHFIAVWYLKSKHQKINIKTRYLFAINTKEHGIGVSVDFTDFFSRSVIKEILRYSKNIRCHKNGKTTIMIEIKKENQNK